MSALVGFNLYTFDRDATGRRSFADLTKFVKFNPTVEDIVNIGTASIGLFRKGFPFSLQRSTLQRRHQCGTDATRGIKIYLPNGTDENLLLKHFGTYGSSIVYQPKTEYQKLKHYK
uniref:RRM domain-containing protein n=1 Tax=Panagrellus redivivus TaxID=6233 RepID=A0A7E4VFB5_PANRE